MSSAYDLCDVSPCKLDNRRGASCVGLCVVVAAVVAAVVVVVVVDEDLSLCGCGWVAGLCAWVEDMCAWVCVWTDD